MLQRIKLGAIFATMLRNENRWMLLLGKLWLVLVCILGKQEIASGQERVALKQAWQCEASIEIEGEVYDTARHVVLRDVEIAFVGIGEHNQGLKRSTRSDQRGRYRLDSLCEGPYHLRVWKEGNESDGTITLEMNTKQKQHLDLAANWLHTKVIDLHYDAGSDHNHERPTAQMTHADIELLGIGDQRSQGLGGVLRQVPGVTLLETGSQIAKPQIHGLGSQRLLIVQNGIRLESQQWGSEHAPEIDAMNLQNIKLYAGSGALRYGSDGLAGVLVLDNPWEAVDTALGRGQESHFKGSAEMTYGTNNGMIASHIRASEQKRIRYGSDKYAQLSIRAGLSAQKSGNVRAPGYVLMNTGREEAAGNLALKLDAGRSSYEAGISVVGTRIGILTNAHIGNVSDLKNAIARGRPSADGHFSYDIERPCQQIQHYQGYLKWARELSAHSGVDISYGYQDNYRSEYDKHVPRGRDNYDYSQPELYLNIGSHTLDVHWHSKQNVHLEGEVGLSGVYQQNVWDGRFLIPNFRQAQGGLYAREVWKKGGWEVGAGARYDLKNLSTYQNVAGEVASTSLNGKGWSWQADASYELKYNQRWLSLYAGSGWRLPSVNELYSKGIHHGTASYEEGNPNLGQERGRNLQIGYIDQQYPFAKLTVKGFVNQYEGFIQSLPTGMSILTIRGSFPSYAVVQNSVWMYGTDLSIEGEEAGWNYMASWSLMRAENRETGDYLDYMPSDRGFAMLRKRITRQEDPWQMQLGIGTRITLRQTRLSSGSLDFAAPPAGYALLDAELHVAKNKQWALTVQGRNLLGQGYREYLDRLRYFSDGMGRQVVFRLSYAWGQPKA